MISEIWFSNGIDVTHIGTDGRESRYKQRRRVHRRIAHDNSRVDTATDNEETGYRRERRYERRIGRGLHNHGVDSNVSQNHSDWKINGATKVPSGSPSGLTVRSGETGFAPGNANGVTLGGKVMENLMV
jgi:hypothetical protein